MKIYIDFDHTLFDTDTFLNDLCEVIIKNNIDMDLYNKYRIKEKKQGFNIFKIVDDIRKEVSIDSKILDSLHKVLSDSNKYVYDDSLSFIKKAKEMGYQIVLLTKGNKEFQLEKIRNTNIYSYFDDIIITLKKKGCLDIDYENSIFIDDSPFELRSIMKKNPKRIVRIKRKDSKYNSIKISNIEEVINLKEIL